MSSTGNAPKVAEAGGACHHIGVLGDLLDTQKMEMSQPVEKLRELKLLIASWMSSKSGENGTSCH